MAEEETKTLAEYLAEKERMQKRLQELGLKPEIAQEIAEKTGPVYLELSQFIAVSENVEVLRAQQFYGTAYEILTQIKQAGDKNAQRVSEFLRNFALHVAIETLKQHDTSIDWYMDQDQVDQYLDHVKEMFEYPFDNR